MISKDLLDILVCPETKQDLKEVYASIRAMLLHILVVVLISAALVYFVALFGSQSVILYQNTCSYISEII